MNLVFYKSRYFNSLQADRKKGRDW